MCGIIYTEGSKALIRAINQYHSQKTRGSEGFGTVLIKKNGSYEIVRATNQKEFLNKIEDKKNIYAVLMHHRYPTSTTNEIEQTHPIVTDINETKYITVHNGIISNTHDLKEQHYSLGLPYKTKVKTTKVTVLKRSVTYDWNDSESLAIELARYFENETNQISATGSIAFITIVVKNNKVQKLYFGRNNSNPLELRRKNNKLIIASSLKKGTSLQQLDILEKKLGIEEKLKETNYFLKYNEPSYGYTYHDYSRWDSEGLTQYNNKLKEEEDDDDDIKYLAGYDGEIGLQDEINLTKQTIKNIKSSKPIDKEELEYAKDHLKELLELKKTS